VKRLGPELKMPDLKNVKVPTFASDVYKDLRDRRLLPVVALVVVAILAVPFLLGGDAEEPVPVPEPPATADLPGGQADGAGLTVVESQPGLRDYRKRLDGRSPTDPFKQQYRGLPAGAQLTESGGGLSEGGGEGSGTVDTSESGGPSGQVGTPPSDSGGPPPPSGGTPPSGGAPDLIEFVVDVQVARSDPGAEEGDPLGKPRTHREVRTFKPVPGRKAPVVTAMGINLRTLKVLFLVSDQAHSLGGEFRCKARTPKGICELVEVEPGFLFEVVYGLNKVRYAFKVTKIDAIRAGKVGADRYERAGLTGGLEGVLGGR
jgi:hypothetical protein